MNRRAYATVSSKGQLVIPAEIRARYGITAGTRIRFLEDERRIVLEPETIAARLEQVDRMRGATRGGPSMTDSLMEARRRERARELTEEGR